MACFRRTPRELGENRWDVTPMGPMVPPTVGELESHQVWHFYAFFHGKYMETQYPPSITQLFFLFAGYLRVGTPKPIDWQVMAGDCGITSFCGIPM